MQVIIDDGDDDGGDKDTLQSYNYVPFSFIDTCTNVDNLPVPCWKH